MKTNGAYITKRRACMLLILFYMAGWSCYQGIWLTSSHTNATILAFLPREGRKGRESEAITVQYYANGKVYTDTYLRNGLSDTTRILPITYLSFAPSISRPNTLLGNWALVLFTSVLFFPVIAIIFTRKDIIPPGSSFLLSSEYPFVRLIGKAGL